MDLYPFLKPHKKGTIVTLKVQPRSSKKGFLGIVGDFIKWGVTAAPVDGRANEELLKSLARVLCVPKEALKIQSGETSRIKSVLVADRSISDLCGLFK